jgi:hypothetical protein
MFQFKFRFAAGLVTFTIGVIVASAVAAVWKVSRIADMERPPCRNCAALYAPSEIPAISICELKNHLEHYRGRVVRVRATFSHDAGQVNLHDDACPRSPLHAGMSDSFQSCAGTRKALTIYSGFGSWYDSAAQVVLIGRAGRLENPTLFEDDNGFNIVCLERVESKGSGKEERVKYTLGRLFGLNPR